MMRGNRDGDSPYLLAWSVCSSVRARSVAVQVRPIPSQRSRNVNHDLDESFPFVVGSGYTHILQVLHLRRVRPLGSGRVPARDGDAELTKDIPISPEGGTDVAAEVVSRVAHNPSSGQASHVPGSIQSSNAPSRCRDSELTGDIQRCIRGCTNTYLSSAMFLLKCRFLIPVLYTFISFAS